MKRKCCFLLTTALCIGLLSSAQKKQAGEQINTLESTAGKTTIGIGMIVDTPSQVSCQYALYSLLNSNPVSTQANERIYPVLTLKRGLTTYYIEGVYSNASIDLQLWQKNTFRKTIHINPKNVKDELPGELDLKEIYKEIARAMEGMPADESGKLKNTLAFESSDELVSKDAGSISTFIFASANNFIPPIDFKKDLYNLFSDGAIETEYNELKELKGKKFKFTSFEEYVEKSYPSLAAQFQTPKFMPGNNMEQAQSVLRLYKIRKSELFFFSSKFVDDKAKIACRKVIFPLWKRPATAITYYAAAKGFMQEDYTDAAIEAYYSALMMTDGLNTYPSVIYYLKSKIYSGLSEAQAKQGNAGSAVVAQQLSSLYSSLINAQATASRNQEFRKFSNEVSAYFAKIEQNAYAAKSEKRAAFWNTITSVVAMTASAINDGANGLSTLSPETQSLVNVASDNMNVVGDYKFNSLTSSAEAAAAFTSTYGDVIKQLQNVKNEVGVSKPVFSLDFVKRLGDKDLALEKKESFLAFGDQFPPIKEAVTKYFNASQDAEKSALLQEIFKSMATMELTLAVKEAMGEKPGLGALSIL